jgi:CubicO group peptidase (beta-lactamase class C family)
MIFDPLDMEIPVLEPWELPPGGRSLAHYYEGGQRIAVGPGDPFNDKPLVYGPAGRVHCSIDDWARFIQIHVNGEWEDQSLLRRNTILRLINPNLEGIMPGGGESGHPIGARRPTCIMGEAME